MAKEEVVVAEARMTTSQSHFYPHLLGQSGLFENLALVVRFLLDAVAAVVVFSIRLPILSTL